MVLLHLSTSAEVTAEQLPFWLTWGWQLIIALVSAIVPCIFSWWRDRSLQKQINDLQNAKAKSIDKANFGDNRQHILSDLSRWQKQLENEKLGISTISNLECLIVRVQSYAHTLEFETQDKKVIDDFLDNVRETISDKSFDVFSQNAIGKIEEIKMIINKGVYKI